MQKSVQSYSDGSVNVQIDIHITGTEQPVFMQNDVLRPARTPEYEAGLRDGRLRAMEDGQKQLEDEVDKLKARTAIQEKVTYGIIGAALLLELFPTLQRLLSA